MSAFKQVASKKLVWVGFICLLFGEFLGGAWVTYQGPNIPVLWGDGWGKMSYIELAELHTLDVATHNKDVATHNKDVATHNKDVQTHQLDVAQHLSDKAESTKDKRLNKALQQIIDQQNERIKSLNTKLGYKIETEKAMYGLLFDAPWMLNHATKINKSGRTDGFPFKDWNPNLTEKLIKIGLKMFSKNALYWITQQPEWESILSEETVNEVKLFLKEYAKTANKKSTTQ